MIHVLLAVIYLSFISLGLPDALLGSAWPVMHRDLNVPVSYAGVISMIIASCTIVSSLLSDRFIRRFGTGKITLTSVAMTAAALFGFSVSGNFAALCLLAVPYGLGAGSVDAALNNFVALHYKAKHMSWLHCFWGIGATLGPSIMGACLTGNLGWNSGYRAIAFIQIALTAVLVFSLPLWKKAVPGTAAADQPSAERYGVARLVSLSGAKPILLAFFCYCSLELVTGLWGSSYMVMSKGIAPQTAALLIALFYFGITGGRFLGGFLTLKLSARNLIRLGQACAAAGIVLLAFSSGPILTGTGFVLIGFGCAPIYPSLLHQTPERFGAAVSQSMMGMQMACAYLGSTLSPFFAGFMFGRAGTAWLPVFLLFFTLLMFCLVEFSNLKTRRRQH